MSNKTLIILFTVSFMVCLAGLATLIHFGAVSHPMRTGFVSHYAPVVGAYAFTAGGISSFAVSILASIKYVIKECLKRRNEYREYQPRQASAR